MRSTLTLALMLSLVGLAPACSCSSSIHGPRRDSGGVDPTTDSNVPPGTDTGTNGGVDANRPDTGFMMCDGLDFDAQQGNRPIDIVWVIDNSGSMDQEATLVQNGMNDLGARISASGITNYHVVVMTMQGWVTVPPPLGTDPSHFLFVNQDVQSHDAFDRALERLPDFRSFLRPDSVMHFVFVTDDEADMQASTFLAMMQGTLGRDDFVAHVIVSPPGSMHREVVINVPGCDGPYGQGAANGQRYWDIASITGGLQLNICSADWGVIFDQLLSAVAVPMPIPCRFAIPDPPAGMTFDPNRVNVVYTTGSGDVQVIPRSDCASGVGWHYDDPSAPTEIDLCADSCTTVENDDQGHVQIQLGCQTVLM